MASNDNGRVFGVRQSYSRSHISITYHLYFSVAKVEVILLLVK